MSIPEGMMDARDKKVEQDAYHSRGCVPTRDAPGHVVPVFGCQRCISKRGRVSLGQNVPSKAARLVKQPLPRPSRETKLQCTGHIVHDDFTICPVHDT